MIDHAYMRRALALAERGRGRTSPNPMVGAVIVSGEGVVVGRGAHLVAGGPHAEIVALADAGDRARGATLYCTLEPCCHTGRTGPCAPRVVDAGLARAVVAGEDPNPLVAGGGIAYLRAHGVDVTQGVLGEEAEALNRPFFTRMRYGRPFVTMKAALSFDGWMAEAPGVRTPLTGSAARRRVHQERAEVDAIAVGSGTVLADDPLLTARGAFRERPLARIIFDSRLRTPVSARLFSTLDAGPVIIISTPSAAEHAPERVRGLLDAGAAVELVEGQPPLKATLERLASLGVGSMVVEGGAALHQALWDANLVDRIELFVAARALGAAGLAWLKGPVFGSQRVTGLTTEFLGDDILIEAYVHRTD
jgi:diaminohydroxyphosphoribosylaminopyrimidine deaminase/5-amino-6-(5-phosphoribosylamino)uracil reductase